MAEAGTKSQSWAPSLRRALAGPLTGAVATVAIGILLVGCGGESAPSLGNETVETTIATTTSTLPPETGTTIDFTRAPNQVDSELPEDATIAEVITIVDNIRGPTADLEKQMRRLAPFAELSSPPGAQIMDLSVTVRKPQPDDEDQRDSIEAIVDFRSPQDPVTLLDFFDAETRSGSWNRVEKLDETVDGVPAVTQEYKVPGKSQELTIRVVGGPFSTVRINYRNLVEEDEDPSFDLLSGWQSDVRTPGSARVVETRLSTAEDIGTLETVYLLTADTAAEAREATASLVRQAEFQQSAADGSGENAAPLVLIDQDQQEFLLEFATTLDPEIIELTVSTSFGLLPID